MTRCAISTIVNSKISLKNLHRRLQQQRILAQYSLVTEHTQTSLTNIHVNNLASGTPNQHVHHSSYVSCFHPALIFSKQFSYCSY